MTTVALEEVSSHTQLDSALRGLRRSRTWRSQIFGEIPLSLLIAALAYLSFALALLPAAQPYDLAGLTGASDAWLRWGVPLFYDWKFGFDLSALAVGAQALRYLLEDFGMSGAAAITAAWKLPLVLANLVSAAGLYDVSLRLKLPRPTALPLVWLLSPVALWVAAGHGQVEPLAAASIIIACATILRRRWALAGLVIGLGVGVEYLPVVVAGAVAVWCLARGVRRVAAIRLGIGLVGGLIVAFGPGLLSAVGRASLFSGLSSTAQATKSSVSALPLNPSVWRLIGVDPGALWIGVLIVVVGASSYVFVRHARGASELRQERAFVVLVGAVLLAVVILDPGSLPQFAVLTLLGLCLVSVGPSVSFVVIVLAPILQLAVGWFYVYGGSFESFWYDMWARSGQPGWTFPQSVFLAAAAGNVSVALVIAGLVLAWARPKLGRPLHLSRSGPRLMTAVLRRITPLRVCLAAGVAVCLFFSIWSLQPRFWHSVGSGGPTSLADWSGETATRQATLSASGGRTAVKVPGTLERADAASRVHGVDSLTLQVRPLLNAQTTGDPVTLTTSAHYTATLRNWDSESASIKSVWLNFLFGSHRWTNPSDATISRSAPMLRTRLGEVPASVVRWLVPDWAEISYSVPITAFSRRGAVSWKFASVQRQIIWNGARDRHWLVVGVRQAKVALTRSTGSSGGMLSFSVPTLGSAPLSTGVLRLADGAGAFSFSQALVGREAASLTAASVVWPQGTPLDSTISGRWLLVVGIGDGLFLVVGALLACGAVAGWRRRSRLSGFSQLAHASS